jgi:hypothetical protein
MAICSMTSLHTPLSECFSIDDVRTLIAKQLGVDLEFVISETHFMISEPIYSIALS